MLMSNLNASFFYEGFTFPEFLRFDIKNKTIRLLFSADGLFEIKPEFKERSL
jgi:hypothetical protein